ncbi:MAG: serine--tRNA ligase [Helicobacteraceae bacterium]|nr:serine--tRNA ligase [Helicobacteraceae bacterium]
MIDLKMLEADFEGCRRMLERKKADIQLLERARFHSLDVKRLRRELEEKQAAQNRLSREFGHIRSIGGDTSSLQIEVNENKGAILALSESLRTVESCLENEALSIPNLPDNDVPDGRGEEDNVEIRRVLTPRAFDFTPKAHFELGVENGWLDFESAAKISGSRFTVMRSFAPKLERALINYMIDFNESYGFKEVWLPVLINRKALVGTAHLPKFEYDLYLAETGELSENDLFLIPTAEAPLINLYSDTIIPEEELPVKLTAHTLCFRKEAGSAGKDTKGMIRQHQFDKVEIVALTAPDESDRMFEEMIDCASSLLTSLELPHRYVSLCCGDLGFGAAKTVDLEVWMPAENRYREISSISNTREFQPRRAKIRYKSDGRNRLVHSLNGSSLAVGRTLIAIMENHQNSDGSVSIPKSLESYL